jgi:hypothetical protein
VRRAWSAGVGLGGGGGDGDLEAEGLELAEVGADLAVAAGFAFVPVGAEVGEPGFGVGEQVPEMTRMERATAHLARFPPRRLDRRRSRSPRKVLVRAAPLAVQRARELH